MSAGDELAPVVTRVAQAALRVFRPVVHSPDAGDSIHRGRGGQLPDGAGDPDSTAPKGWPGGRDVAGRSISTSGPTCAVLGSGIEHGESCGGTRSRERVLAAWHDLNHLASGPEALTSSRCSTTPPTSGRTRTTAWSSRCRRCRAGLGPDEFAGGVERSGMTAADTTEARTGTRYLHGVGCSNPRCRSSSRAGEALAQAGSTYSMDSASARIAGCCLSN